MSRNIVDSQFEEGANLISFLTEKNEISYASSFHDIFSKILIISAASYFEEEIKSIILNFVINTTKKTAKNKDLLISFVKNKSIERQYHTLFEWNKNNANQFFGLFGENFLKKVKIDISIDQKLKDSISAFIKIGQKRNLLAHQNFSTFPVDKTAKEVYHQYELAQYFIEYLKKVLI
jgi:hypothetical protein